MSVPHSIRCECQPLGECGRCTRGVMEKDRQTMNHTKSEPVYSDGQKFPDYIKVWVLQSYTCRNCEHSIIPAKEMQMIRYEPKLEDV